MDKKGLEEWIIYHSVLISWSASILGNGTVCNILVEGYYAIAPFGTSFSIYAVNSVKSCCLTKSQKNYDINSVTLMFMFI